MLISSSQEVEADSGQAASSTSVPVLPQGMTYWDPHLGSVVHRTCEGLIKAKTSPGPQGFLVGTFEGFEAQPFVTEVPNLALQRSKTNTTQAELPLGKENGQKKSKQKGQGLKKNGHQKKLEAGHILKEKGQKKRKQALASGVFRLTKASAKWYICQKNEQGKLVHVVTVLQKTCPHFDKVAQRIFQNLQSHPGTSQAEAIAMRDRLMQ